MDDLIYILHWLARPGIDQPYTLSTLIQQMHARAESNDFSSALSVMEKLKSNSQMVHRLERASILLECAIANWQMHNPGQSFIELQAIISLLAGISRFDQRCMHLKALALWMMGAIRFQDVESGEKAESYWQKSLDLVQSLSTNYEVYDSARRWYYDRSLEMQQAINEAISGKRWVQTNKETALHCGRLESLDIYNSLSDEQLRAPRRPGSFGVIKLQPISRRVRIADGEFWLKSLRSPDDLLILDSSQAHFVLGIPSDRMDRLGLNDGDYVLVREQRQAEGGDIVLVDFIEDSISIGVYTLTKHENKFLFTSQSSTSNHRALEFFANEKGSFYIHGVVMGMFKPIKEIISSRSDNFTEEKTGSNNNVKEAPFQEESPIPIADFLQTFPLYEKIPAGEKDVLPVPTGEYLEFDRFIIQDQVYIIRNLRNGRRIRPRCKKVMILKVVGDSMNLAGIDSGDYVLLCVQDHAKHNDIVAAQISKQDPMALLKRYVEYDDHFVLRPESSNSSHKDKEFEKRILSVNVDERMVYIRGVALAVLKPLNPGRPK